MVPVGGLEPPRPKATDFESRVATDIHFGSKTLRLTEIAREAPEFIHGEVSARFCFDR